MLKISEYAKRRKQLMQKIGAHGIFILPAASIAHRNGDYGYPFRQNSDFYYLTGFEEPEAVMVLIPKRKEGEFILFNRAKDRDSEIWEGRRAGQAGACRLFGADQSFPITQFKEKLPELLQGCQEIHYTLGIDARSDKMILKAVNKIRGKIRHGLQTPFAFIDSSTTLHEMRMIKSPAEIALMRKAAEITADAHIRAMRACRPGMFEYQLEAEIIHEFQRNGARFPAYTSIIGSGANACILHYTENKKMIRDGELVLIDAGCEYDNYASDVTRTFPANGRFSPEQRAIYEIVLKAQLAGIKAVRPGKPFTVIQETMINIITQGLLDLGILKGKRKALIEKQAYYKFYMHKSGHWLGLDVHDVGRYKVGDKWRTLQPGMVLTVEPGIYIASDIPGVAKRWKNIGVRIEDDVLVTQKGCEVLNHKLPKTVADIEALMRKR